MRQEALSDALRDLAQLSINIAYGVNKVEQGSQIDKSINVLIKNVNLIEAAPNLLEACKRLLNIVEAESEACGFYKEHIKIATDAIKKAKGGE